MTVRFVAKRVWTKLWRAARFGTGHADVAVAYFGQGAARLLPLRPGSRLVVDASDGAVRAGQTCPAELLKLQSRGVRIYSAPCLHAKVYVFGRRAYVGSANASGRSANTLVEAVVEVQDRAAVAAARRFVLEQCGPELGPDHLKSLAKIYRPPKVPAGPRRPKPAHPFVVHAPTHVVHLQRGPLPPSVEEAMDAGREVAKTRRRIRSHALHEFWWRGRAFAPGEVLVQVVEEPDGRKMVDRPGIVIYTRRRGGGTFVYLEVPLGRRVHLDRLATRMGRGAKKRLLRGGRFGDPWKTRLLAALER